MSFLKKFQKNPDFKSKIFDTIFLIILVLVYSLLSFYNLGDDKAPQTFYRLYSEQKLALILPEKTEISKIAYYVGISKNDFLVDYQFGERTTNCNCSTSSISDFTLSKENEFAVDGPFRWRETEIKKEASIIILSPKNRDVDFGEIMVFSKDQKIENVEYRLLEYENLLKNEDLDRLKDEQDLLPSQFNYHNSSYFDELYFAQTAYQYATNQEGYENVHPPLGKILQSLPIRFFGRMTPFTWRFAGNIAGILIIIIVYFFAKELFKNASYGRLAAVLVSLCGLHFVQTRLGTIDSYLYLFTLLTFFFMLKFLRSNKFRFFLLSGIFFGCAVSVKWSGAFAGIGLAIMFFYWIYQTYLLGLSKKNWKQKVLNLKLLKWLPLGTLCFILIPSTIYFGSYLIFPETTNAYSASDVISQGEYLYEYHSGERTPHPYSSPWFSWPVSAHPMLYEYNKNNITIWLYGNYALAFISVIALITMLYFAITKKSKTALFIIIAYLSLWLPYAFIQRPMFLYHYLPASGFAILATVGLFYELPKTRKIIPFLLLMILLVFIVSYPRYAGV